MTDALGDVVTRTCARGGKVIIPSFALERAQEVLFALKQLERGGRLPRVPIYVDSPLTVRLTEIFKLHPECYDSETAALLAGSDSPFELEGLRYISDVAASQAVTAAPGPAIVIAASGMCEAGRVLHHLQASIGDPRSAVVIVGFQAQHTLGRRLVERRSQVRIFGVMRERAAEVVVLNGFSAHADQHGLIDFAAEVARRGRLRRVLLVHGEPRPQETLAAQLRARGVCDDVHALAMGETVRLS
jgi:metallo-beta-lactamase family protein